MSDESYSSDSSIAEDESLSQVELQPEEIEAPYDLLEFDALETEAEERKQESATVPREPADASDPIAAAAVPLSLEFRSLLQEQPFSPIKAAPAPAAASVPAPAPLVVALAPLPPPLRILDPTQPAASDAAQALSRTEPLPILARLLSRVRRKQQAEPAAPAVAPAASVLQSAIAPLPPAVLGSLLDRLRSAAPASKTSWALQPDLLPVAAPPLRQHPLRTSVLQAQLDQQRSAFFSASAVVGCGDDKENHAIVTAVSADPSYEPPSDCCSALDVDSRLASAQRFPETAQPLKLAVAQTRMQAALLSMKTHQFRSAYSLPQSATPCDFGATVLSADSAAPTTTSLDSASALIAPLLSTSLDSAAASGAALPSSSTRHACSNPAAMHRDAWLDPVLNRLYASRMNPTSVPDELQATQQLHATILQSNSMRTQRDLLHSANRTFFQCGES